jgi:hypothetical protein
MRHPMLFACAVALAAGAAQAQPVGPNPPTSTIICLDVGGQSLPAVCDVPAGRLDKRENICTCPRGMRTEVAICPPGVDAPPESRALERARRDAVRKGSLIGATWQGRPMCVAPRHP